MRDLRRVASLLAWVLGVGGCAGRGRSRGDLARWEDDECLTTYTLRGDEAPLAVGSQARVPAATIDPAAQKPVESAAHLRLDGRPIAWLSLERDAVVVDGQAFAPLRVVDVTRAAAGERHELGRVTPRGREALGPRGVVELLLRTGAIVSYRNLGADLCLHAEATRGGSYRAELRAVHQRAAGARHRVAYAFAVELAPAGGLAVLGRGSPGR